MARALKLGQMVQNLKEPMFKAKSMAKENFISLMVAFMRESFSKMRYVTMETTSGQMGKYMKVNGNKIK